MSSPEVQVVPQSATANSTPSEDGVWAGNLPIGSRGYVDDYAVALGADACDYSPQFSRLTKVYRSPSDGRNATLVRTSKIGFRFELPPGQSWAGKSSFGAILATPVL